MNIPRILHHVWVGSPLPERFSDNLEAWGALHPSWEQRLWADGDLCWLWNLDLFDNAEKLVPADAVGQFQADIARYEILAVHGGFYADVDTYPIEPIDELLEGKDAFAVAEDPVWIANTYLGAVPEHPVMQELHRGLRANIGANRGLRPNRLSGPRYLTPVWLRHGCYVAPTGQFFPYSYTDVRNRKVPSLLPRGTYAVHQWDHTRRMMGV